MPKQEIQGQDWVIDIQGLKKNQNRPIEDSRLEQDFDAQFHEIDERASVHRLIVLKFYE